MMTCHGITKRYGSILAAEEISFVAPDGQVTGLLGPNGAGKSTTIRALVGLTRPDAGTVAVDTIDVARDPSAARARLGILPEAVGLYDRLTVREHLAYSAELHGLTGDQTRVSVDAVLMQLALTSLADRFGSQLSSGEARRVALGRALVHNPQNIVLDEPTNGLDVLSARDLRRWIRQLATLGRAVLLSSHVMPEVSAVCDQIVILARGRVLATGTPRDIQHQAGATTLEDAFAHLIGSEEGCH